MIASERGLFIYRPVNSASLPKLRKLQAEYTKIETFRPVEAPHLSLLQGKILPRINGKARDDVIAAAPETVEEPYEMRITQPQFHRWFYGMSRLAIALVLNDSDGHYRDEYQTFRKAAIQKSDKKDLFVFREPHVTIGYFNPSFALKSVLEVAEKLNDQTIGFDPAMSNLGKVKKFEKPHAESDLSDIQVRTLSPGSIPANFLASLKKHGSQTESAQNS